MNDSHLVAGRPEHWHRFQRDRAEFLKQHPRLIQLSNAVYRRNWVSAEPVDRVIFSLGILCWEDYEEILLLGMNGYGFGAQKILRGMFERAVTASYLHRHSDEVDRFIDYGHVSDWKLANELFTANGEASGVSAERHAQTKRLRDAVVDQFKNTCREKGCGREVDGFSWSKVDLVAMAREDQALRSLVGLAYYRPLAETHVSVRALISRTDVTEEGATLDNREQRAAEESDRAVQLAHHLTLLIIRNQIDHFADLAEAKLLWDECVKDFRPSWSTAEFANEQLTNSVRPTH